MTELLERRREVEHWELLSFRARSFRWASTFLSRAQRRRVAMLYAFCREVDDLADSDQVESDARSQLERLLLALQAEPDGESLWPEDYRWFRALCVECNIDFRIVEELVSGMLSDLDVVRFQSDAELVRYCYRVAGTVGLMMCAVFDVRDPRAWRHAVDLGIAMQMTNILRDVLEDARASRVYLPAARLRAYGLAANELVGGVADPTAVSALVGDLLAWSERYYQSADAGMRFLPRRPRWAVLIASRLYRGIGRRLRRRHRSNPMFGRVVVPWFEKLGLVVSATLSWVRLSLWPSTTAPLLGDRDYLADLPRTGRCGPATVVGDGAPRMSIPSAAPEERMAGERALAD